MSKKKGDENQNETGKVFNALALFTQLGISMAACVFVGVIAGKLADTLFGTSPWLLVVFGMLGGAASIKVMYDIVIKGWRDK